MKKFILALSLTALSSVFAAAQTTTDDYKKSEFFIGYSNNQVDTGIDADGDFSDLVDERESFHGFNVSGVYNVNRYLGIKGDVSGTYNSKDFNFTVPAAPSGTGTVTFSTSSSLYNFLGGVQLKDNSRDGRFKPFAHALVGAGHGRVKIKDVGCSVGVDCTGLEGTTSETGLAGAFGGGLDIRVSDNFSIRAIQVDYNPIKFDSGTSHNVRLGFGIVF